MLGLAFMSRLLKKPFLLILLTLTGLFFAIHPLQIVSAQPGLPVVGVWSSAHGASNVTDTTLVVASTLTIEVNVTGAPLFNGYEFSLYYDPSFLRAQSVDFTTGTVFNAPFVARNDLSQAGTVAVAVVNLGSSFSGGSGILLHIHFLVTNVGVSPLTLAQGTASPGFGAQSWTRLVNGLVTIDVVTTDGYFKNDASRLGPVAFFTVIPTSPLLGDRVIFDSSTSFDPDNNTSGNRGLIEYMWDFGDGVSVGTFFPVASHRFGQSQVPGFSGNFSVRLTVLDVDDGFLGMITQPVTVSTSPPQTNNFQINLFSGPFPFQPGGSVNTGVTVQSQGGFQGNVSMSAHVSPTIPNGPTVSIASKLLRVPSGGFAQTSVAITTTPTTPPGNYGIIVTGTSGALSQIGVTLVSVLHGSFFPSISVRDYFTDESGNSLPVDSTGSPSVNVVIAHGAVRSTNPGQIVAWMNVTNTGTVSFSSLRVEETLPTDWAPGPLTRKSGAETRVFFQFGSGTLLDITTSGTTVLSGTNPETVELTFSNLTSTLSGKTLDPGESILLSVKLDYELMGTPQIPKNFPKTYGMASEVSAWMVPAFTGSMASSAASAFFKADSKVMGDVNGDSKVNILDLAIVAYSFNSKPGSPDWNPAANFDGSGQIDIGDLAVVGFNFGDSY